MRNADISPATEEERREQFREAAAGLYGPPMTLEQILHRVRLAMLDEQKRQAALTATLCTVLNSPPDEGGV